MDAAAEEEEQDRASKAALAAKLEAWLDSLGQAEAAALGVDAATLAALAWAEWLEAAPAEEIYHAHVARRQQQAVKRMCAELGFEQLRLYDMRQMPAVDLFRVCQTCGWLHREQPFGWVRLWAVLWADPAAAVPERETMRSATYDIEVPQAGGPGGGRPAFLLLYSSPEDREPLLVAALRPGGFEVSPPKSARRGYPHTLRLSLPAAVEGDSWPAGLKKLVLAAPAAEQRADWAKRLAGLAAGAGATGQGLARWGSPAPAVLDPERPGDCASPSARVE